MVKRPLCKRKIAGSIPAESILPKVKCIHVWVSDNGEVLNGIRKATDNANEYIKID